MAASTSQRSRRGSRYAWTTIVLAAAAGATGAQTCSAPLPRPGAATAPSGSKFSLIEAQCPVTCHDPVTAELVAQADELLGLCLGAEGFVVFAIGRFAPVGAVLLATLFNPHVVLLVCRACLDTTDRPVPELRGKRRPRELSHPCREAGKRMWTGAPPRGGTGPHSRG